MPVELAELLERIDDPADLVVGVFQEVREVLRLAGEQRLMLRWLAVPGRDLLGPLGQLGAPRDDAHLQLVVVHLAAVLVPAHVEPAGVATAPVEGRLVGCMCGAGPEVRFLPHHPQVYPACCNKSATVAQLFGITPQ